MADVWQEEREFEETNLHMLNDDVLSDVTFLMGSKKDVVKAHKFMLASRRPVFYAMFCGPMSETSSTIEISDIEPETMHSILRFIYTEDCEVSGESVMALLYAAKKYSIKRLEQKCRTFLKEQISCENVCTIFTQGHVMGEVELEQDCFTFIITNCKQVLHTEGFRTLPRELLKEILESDDTSANEEDIYDGCKHWATYRLHNAEESRDVSHSEIRNLLGDLLYLIRFPIMSLKTFSTKCSSDGILSPDEKISIFQLISGIKDVTLKFNDKIRAFVRKRKIARIPEFYIMSDYSCYYDGNADECGCDYDENADEFGWAYDGNADAIDFIVSETAMLFGIGLYSPAESGSIKGDVSLLRCDGSVLTDKVVYISYNQSNKYEEVLFDKGVYLEPNNKYTIKVVLEGSRSYFGYLGNYEVTEGDFSVTFSNSDINTGRTDVNQGQIPFLILGFKQK